MEISRRQAIKGISGVALLLAGCTDSNPPQRVAGQAQETLTETKTSSSTPRITETPASETQTESSTATEGDEILVEIVSHDWWQGEYEGDVGVMGVAKNSSPSTLRYVEVAAEFMDADGIVVGEGFTNETYVYADSGFKFVLNYYSETDTPWSEVKTYELYYQWTESYLGEDNEPGDGLVTVIEDELKVVEEYGRRTTVVEGIGENTAGEALHYASVEVRFYDEQNIIIGWGSSIKEALSGGAKWKFQADYYSSSDTPHTEIADYEIWGEGTTYD